MIAWYGQHSTRANGDRDREWAEMQYLIIAQDLNMFGVNYFLIQVPESGLFILSFVSRAK